MPSGRIYVCTIYNSGKSDHFEVVQYFCKTLQKYWTTPKWSVCVCPAEENKYRQSYFHNNVKNTLFCCGQCDCKISWVSWQHKTEPPVQLVSRLWAGGREWEDHNASLHQRSAALMPFNLRSVKRAACCKAMDQREIHSFSLSDTMYH